MFPYPSDPWKDFKKLQYAGWSPTGNSLVSNNKRCQTDALSLIVIIPAAVARMYIPYHKICRRCLAKSSQDYFLEFQEAGKMHLVCVKGPNSYINTRR